LFLYIIFFAQIDLNLDFPNKFSKLGDVLSNLLCIAVKTFLDVVVFFKFKLNNECNNNKVIFQSFLQFTGGNITNCDFCKNPKQFKYNPDFSVQTTLGNITSILFLIFIL
jgi:hypothetical protein